MMDTYGRLIKYEPDDSDMFEVKNSQPQLRVAWNIIITHAAIILLYVGRL